VIDWLMRDPWLIWGVVASLVQLIGENIRTFTKLAFRIIETSKLFVPR
jgi:hypothetical protein